MNATFKRLRVALPILALVAAAGCASSSDSGASSSEGAKLTGGTKATGEPIKVGYLNPSIGANAFTDSQYGAAAAVWYINNYLGGMADGRPIDMINCDSDNTPEKNVSCANKFVEEKVVAVIPGNVINDGATLPILEAAGIPQIGNVPQDAQSVATQKNFYTGPAQALYSYAPLKAYSEAGIKSVALLQTDLPASHDYVDSFLKPVGKKLGVKVTAVYFDADNPNWTVLAQALISSKAEVVGHVSLTEDQNTEFVKALRAAGYTGKIQISSTTEFIKTLGLKSAVGSIIYSSNWFPKSSKYAPARVQKELKDFQGALAATDHAGLETVNTLMPYSSFVTFAKVLKTMKGDITGPAISKAYLGLKDFPSELGPDITCDFSVWPGQSACSNKLLLLEVQKDGTYKPIGSDGYTEATPADIS